ncbi:hypothetical protein DFH06DRAFT_1295131 [Mycena polygramma]|nr:hypothetical protein DFH06DRAFT_1295131 [Mycena polygramma]
MIALKSKKGTKHTYAERVLSSFSLLQREHKKHAIHLASLRAQVQKTADARKDKLGPHWKNWVGKAVHRLEEVGILESSEQAGTVALTPDGKKAILAARRTLALPAHDSLSPDQEDLLWKQVAYPGSVQVLKVTTLPVKRARHTNDSEDSDDEPEYVPPKSRKRARTSPASSKTSNPAFKLTKAQLIEELAIMKRAREAERLRAASPLTELEDDESEELMRLKEILKHKDEEMRTMQRQLANRNFEDNAPDSSDVEMSSPLRQRFVAVTRTQSGSHINHLSKQPTPAPTELDPSDHNDDDIFNFDDPNPVSVPPVSFLATPDVTPAKTLPTTYLNKISSLEHALQLRTTELQNLVHKLSEHESQRAQTEKSISSKDARISLLETNLTLFESQLPDFERAKADLEASIAEKAVHVKSLIHERDDAIASLKNEQNEHERELSRLRTELSDSEHAVDAHATEIQAAHARAASLESDIADLRRELDSQGVSSAHLTDERARLEGELLAQRALAGTTEESNQSLLERIVLLDQRIGEQNAVEVSLKEELARTEAACFTASEKLLAAEETNTTLVAHLAETADKLTVSQQGHADARAALEALKPQMEALDDALTKRISSQREVQERLGKTQREADNFRMQVGILETTVANLRSNLEAKKLEAEQLTRDLTERVDANSALVASLQEKEQQLTDVGVAKDGLQTTLDEVTSKLQRALDAEAQLEETRAIMDDRLAAAAAANTSLIAELSAASAMADATSVKLQDAEGRVATLGSAVASRDVDVEQLRVQLGESVGRVGELEQMLDAAGARYASDLAEKQAAYLALEKTLSSAQEAVTRLTLEVSSVRMEREDVQGRLEGEVRRIGDALVAEQLRRKTLEAEREEAELELLELRVSKDADAATIEGLKEVFSQLKATQMQSLAELDYKLESAQSSPIPRRRASKVLQTVRTA